MVLGILGIALLYFVQDPRSGPVTFNGMMHIILAAVCSLLSMVVIVLAGLSFREHPNTRKLAAYSFLSFAVVFVAGGITAVSTANNSRFGGLFERLTIGGFPAVDFRHFGGADAGVPWLGPDRTCNAGELVRRRP